MKVANVERPSNITEQIHQLINLPQFQLSSREGYTGLDPNRLCLHPEGNSSIMFSPAPGEWEENFQDLSGWCMPTTSVAKHQFIADPVELNTPVRELGCEELQLNMYVAKAVPNFDQDTETKFGVWSPLDEPSLLNLWLPNNTSPAPDRENTDMLSTGDSLKEGICEETSKATTRQDQNVLVRQDVSIPLAIGGGICPENATINAEAKIKKCADNRMKTKMSITKPKLKLDIPGNAVFNDTELITPNIVNMLVESPIRNMKKPGGMSVLEFNVLNNPTTNSFSEFDGPDDLLQPLVELGGGFDLLAYMFEETPKTELTKVSVETISNSADLGENYLNINELSCLKASHLGQQLAESVFEIKDIHQMHEPTDIIWKTSDVEKPGTSTRKRTECNENLLQKTMPTNALIKEELTSDDDQTYLPDRRTKMRKLKRKSSTKTLTVPAKCSRRSVSSSSRHTTTSNHSDTTSENKYRELRDRNNKASKRSRHNRKLRDGEMLQEALRLEKENRSLKIKAEEMERLVKQLRESLLQTITKPK